MDDESTLTFVVNSHMRSHAVNLTPKEYGKLWQYIYSEWYSIPMADRSLEKAHQVIGPIIKDYIKPMKYKQDFQSLIDD